MAELRFRAMGCGMAAFLDADGPRAVSILREVPAWFEEWEKALSRFRPDSELSQLNNSSGVAFPASAILWEVILAALQAARSSGGLVAPNMLRSLERAGYDRSFDQLRLQQKVAAPEVLEKEQDQGVDWRDIDLDEARKTILIPPGMKIDLGGIAKGWAAQTAAQRLGEIGPSLVDAGGDIAVSDFRADGTPWQVAVADPLHVEDSLGTLMLGPGGVATSGVDYRLWLQNGVWKHHIIDPRTSEPAVTDLASVTVIAPDLLQAEAGAKTILIKGSQEGLDWIEDSFPLAGLLACQDGRVIFSTSMNEYLWRDYGG